MMENSLGMATLDDLRAIHIAPLSRQTIIDNDAEHLGFGGLFLFETNEAAGGKGISVLAKAASIEAAFQMLSIWNTKIT